MKELACFRFLHPLIRYNVVKQLSPTGILHDQIQLLWSFYYLHLVLMVCFRAKGNYFIKLNDVGMTNKLEDMNFSSHSFYVTHVLNFVLFKNFDSNLLIRINNEQ